MPGCVCDGRDLGLRGQPWRSHAAFGCSRLHCARAAALHITAIARQATTISHSSDPERLSGPTPKAISIQSRQITVTAASVSEPQARAVSRPNSILLTLRVTVPPFFTSG